MRDIKFRGFTINEEKYGNGKDGWIYGNLLLLDNKKAQIQDINDDNFLEFVDIKSLGEYTGLKDKNGKEIYEGDIVKVKLYKGEEEKYFIGKVEYFGGNFIVDADNNSEYHVYDLDGFGIDYRYNLEDCEVIGNIYDNPELLEEGE